jgi:hypothetical protein
MEKTESDFGRNDFWEEVGKRTKTHWNSLKKMSPFMELSYQLEMECLVHLVKTMTYELFIDLEVDHKVLSKRTITP